MTVFGSVASSYGGRRAFRRGDLKATSRREAFCVANTWREVDYLTRMPKDEHAMLQSYDATSGAREMRPSLLRGWRGRCPSCGSGRIFTSYLKVGSSCEFCGQDFSGHRADDAPAWLTMLVVGHLLAPLILGAYGFFDLPMAAHLILWPTLAIILVLALLPRIKGAVVAFQWAQKMHGFDDQREN